MEKWNLLSFFRTIHSQLAVSEGDVIAGSFEDPASRAEPLLIGYHRYMFYNGYTHSSAINPMID